MDQSQVSSKEDTNSKSSPPKKEKKHNFKEGQILTLVRVRFPGHNKSYPFIIGNTHYQYGQKVVAMSDRGMAVGYINSFPYEVKFKESLLPLRKIKKVATDEDVENQIENYKKEKEAEVLCKRLIHKHELDMNLTHVEFTQFGKKCVFYFTAPSRVDFRNLVKDLVSELKLRIELRQITVRDRAAAVGGIGSCGRQLCCSSFLEKYGQVNIKMAKGQDLSINFDKLNGVCGQIKCCIKYEDKVYQHKKEKLPVEGKLASCVNGDRGKVIRLHTLMECFDMITDKGVKRRYNFDQLKEKNIKFKMPDFRSFDHISDETHTIIGLSGFEKEKAEQISKELEKIKKSEEGFGDETFKEMFGTASLKNEFNLH